MIHPLVPDFHPQPFYPPALLRNGHTMTIFAALYKREFALPAPEKREFKTDPDTTIMAYCHWQPKRPAHKTILQIHGLEGDADRHYMLGAATKAWRAGFNVIRMNVRNCGGTEHLTPTMYHSGWTADIRSIVLELIAQDKLEKIFLVGFSMGGNQSLKFAGELGTNAPAALQGLVAISPPIDLELCSLAIKEPRNFIYDRRFLKSLKKRMQIKAQHFPGLCDVEKLARVKNLWDFDEVVTAPVFGFRDARDYYAQASAKPYLQKIRVPTLILQAQDDPFIPFTPFAENFANEFVAILGQPHGGHVGFWQRRVNGSNGADNYWAEQAAVDFCCAV